MGSKREKITIHILGYAYAFIMMFLLARVIYRKVPLLTLIIVSVSAYAIINLMLSTRKMRLISAVLIAFSGISAGVLLATNNAGFLNKQWASVMSLCFRLYHNMPVNTPELLSASLLLFILASVGISIVIFVFFVRFYNFLLITAALISMQVFTRLATGYENRWIIAVICLLTVAAYFRHIYEKKVKSGLVNDHRVPGGVMLFTIPAAIIPIIIIMLIPKSDKPIQVPWLTNKIMTVINNIQDQFTRINDEFFSLTSAGFNDSSEPLGGPIRPSSTIVMEVKSDLGTYLRGASYSWYEDGRWFPGRKQDITYDENERNQREIRQAWEWIRTDALFPDANSVDAELLRNLTKPSLNLIMFPKCSLEVTYKNITTRSLFTPLMSMMPVKAMDGSPYPAVEYPDGIMVADKKIVVGSRYKLDFIQPMYGDPMFKQALTFSSNHLYRDALEALIEERSAFASRDPLFVSFYLSALEEEEGPGTDSEKYIRIERLAKQYGIAVEDYYHFRQLDKGRETLSALIQNSAVIHYVYTALSDDVTERVRTLSLEVTKDCDNDYEKLLAIQNHLRENCSYTMNASRVPPEKDFVDWFLFEDPNGYCTYFATAMTIMLRCNNIPARYVEGYVMPGEPDGDSVYTISNRFAHAWVEAYFEGFGWLTFDPTPVYTGLADYSIGPKFQDLARAEGQTTEFYEAMLEKYIRRSDIPGYVPVVEAVVTETVPQKEIDIRYIPRILAGLALFFICINLMASAADNIRLSGMDSKKKVIHYITTMLGWLENSRYPINAGESFTEYAARIEKSFGFLNKNLTEAAKIFSKVRYGAKDVTPKEMLIVKRTFGQVKAYVLKDMGIKRFIPLRHILLKI